MYKKSGDTKAMMREATRPTAASVLGYCTFEVELFASSHGL